ncbi:MAG TPA: hypothetical protein VHN77_07630 [Phycisphaerales bacterium]|nr:hypothetical protein [Phycisphaerales bacterium]
MATIDAQPTTDVQATGKRLQAAMLALLEAIPGAPHRPTPLSAKLGISRVTVNNMLTALQRPTTFELLEAIPGPESLRAAASAAAGMGVDPRAVDAAVAAIDEFSVLIRDHFGTRAALNAAIGGRSNTLRAKVEQSGRVQVFNGMRQILGVEAETWVNAMFFVPSPDDPEAVGVTTLHGALGMRRLRSDTQVYFTFGAPYRTGNDSGDLSQSPVSMQEFYTHDPASVETGLVNGMLRHRLVQDRLGKHAVLDMLAVSHNPKGSRRHATQESPLRGVSLFVDVPVRTLVFDAVVQKDLFPGVMPQLFVYNPGARGPANPNDPSRDADRMGVIESPVLVPGSQRFEVNEVPNYARMIARLCGQLGRKESEFSVYRLVMAYPVHGFQYVLAFRAPLA